MNEDEAIALLLRELTTPSGLLAALRRGEGLHLEAMQASFAAIDTLGQCWQGMLSVPKHAVFALAHADDAFGPLGIRNPYVNVVRVQSDFMSHIQRALLPQEWARAEAQVPDGSPARLLMDVFIGEHSFVEGLRDRQGIDQRMVVATFEAFDAVRAEWRQVQRIPRGVAYALASARGAVSGCWGSYRGRPETQAAVLDLANEAGKRVLRCLQDNAEETFEQARLSL